MKSSAEWEITPPLTPKRRLSNHSNVSSPNTRINTTSNTNSNSSSRRYSSPLANSSISISQSNSPLDRFIPSRKATNLEEVMDISNHISESRHFETLASSNSIANPSTPIGNITSDTSHSSMKENRELLHGVIRSELLGIHQPSTPPRCPRTSSNDDNSSYSTTSSPASRPNMLKFNLSSNSPSTTSPGMNGIGMSSSVYHGTLNESQKKNIRKISKVPYKVLNVPHLCDDFYLNLVDWSNSNCIAVALGNTVCVWSAFTSKGNQLCDLGALPVTSVSWSPSGDQLAVGDNSGVVSIWDVATSCRIREFNSHNSRVGVLAWSNNLLATGGRDRHIYVHDLRIRDYDETSNDAANLSDVTSRTQDMDIAVDLDIDQSTMNLFDSIPSSSSMRYDLDVTRRLQRRVTLGSPRTSSLPRFPILESAKSPSIVYDFFHHRQEVCGLKWSFDDKYLASGGNDNKLLVWSTALGHSSSSTAGNLTRNAMNTDENFNSSNDTNPRATSNTSKCPLYEFTDHHAAVKALCWSPHQHGVLASGGGTADRHIRFWNVSSGCGLAHIDTGSQVCNIMWSKSVNEIVSTHGYSLNQINIWKYPTMQKLATLTGHSLRVLYLAGSPDGQSIVTGAGDETLRFWNVFPGFKNRSNLDGRLHGGVLMPSSLDIR